jgi:5-methylthioadenosine/S-adenosylhomocysteine deaminase
MATSVPARLARVSDHIGALAPGKLADFVVINAVVDSTKSRPLDPVVRATPADIVLVVVGGRPVYGDPLVLSQVLPVGAKTEQMAVCGTTKSVYLGERNELKRGHSLAEIKAGLIAALARAGSSLPDIECD